MLEVTSTKINKNSYTSVNKIPIFKQLYNTFWIFLSLQFSKRLKIIKTVGIANKYAKSARYLTNIPAAFVSNMTTIRPAKTDIKENWYSILSLKYFLNLNMKKEIIVSIWVTIYPPNIG